MNIFQVTALLLTLAALFSYVNHRFIRPIGLFGHQLSFLHCVIFGALISPTWCCWSNSRARPASIRRMSRISCGTRP
jgi:hypothetical protein